VNLSNIGLNHTRLIFFIIITKNHSIEPITSTFKRLANASSVLGYEKKGFVLTQAVVSSRDGEMEFSGKSGQENLGIHDQRACQNPSDCKKVPMYSADSYFDKFVQSKGPVNMLLIDVEGWDFDVLFGASSVLDRTQYLEFEYHSTGPWGRYHLPDTVRLLDHKGFTCYWSGKSKLWRITGCYFDVYNTYHGWSNVACVHRTYEKLAERMESLFLATMKENEVILEMVDGRTVKFCKSNKWKGTNIRCEGRAQFLVSKHNLSVQGARTSILVDGCQCSS
jgi:FkbM family methyltransferase